MRTGIYGGTFAPPHNGHVAAARAFIDKMRLDELLIIPAFLPPHKAVSSDDLPQTRVEMCRLAFSGLEKTVVSELELQRGGKSYTSDTLAVLTEPGRELFMLCGTDMILTLDSWHCPDEIFGRCTPVCVRRENDGNLTAALHEKLDFYEKKYGVRIPVLDTPVYEISSSEIRNAVKNGESLDGRVPSAVAEYITESGLYK